MIEKIKDISKLEDISAQVKRDIVRMVHQCQSGHPGGSLGCSDLIVALYFNIMDHNPTFNMSGEGEDIFILSNGHISPVLYSVLSRIGFFPVEELATFRHLNTRLQGHPTTAKGLPGVRISTGSLGQGLSVAMGIAISKKLNSDDKTVFALCGDGEMQEGQIWEALMYAGTKKLDNIVLIIDANNIQIDGTCEEVMSLGNLKDKLTAFDWEAIEVKNGNEMSVIVKELAIAKGKTKKGSPIAVILNTCLGKGVDYMEHNNKWHGSPPSDELLEKALAQLPETIGDY